MFRRAGRGPLGLAVALLGLAAAEASAADEIVAMQQGPPIVGEVLGVAGDAFRVRTGDAILTVEFWRVTPEALYRLLHARTPLEEPTRRIELADTLRRFFHFDGARAELRAARALDSTLRDAVALRLADVEDAHAAWLLQVGMEAQADGRFADAVGHLETLARQFEGSAPATRARELLPAAREGAARQAKVDGPKRGGDATAPKADPRLLRAVAGLLQKMDAALESAMAALKTGHQHDAKGLAAKAEAAYQDAATRDEEARDWADRVVQAGTHVPEESRQAAAERRARAETHLLLVYRAQATLAMVQKQFTRARMHVLRALEIDPAHTDLLALKAKIESEMLRAVEPKGPAPAGGVK